MKSALLIIDMQNDFILPEAPAEVPGAMKIVPKVKKLLEFCRARKIPVFHVIRQYRYDGSDIENFRREGFLNRGRYLLPGTPGAEIIDELKPAEGEYVIVKPRFSAFFCTELELILKRIKTDDIVICGVQYPNCIRATALDSVSYDYSTTVITDATAGADDEIEVSNIRDLRNIGIKCLTFAEWSRQI
ncbi:MAG TPA: isochorismatase family cysteine hydrolase [Spirochaetota bacterium]|nr:isochorismatase family cysteine hydrolase [Spirochaetota bacterium]